MERIVAGRMLLVVLIEMCFEGRCERRIKALFDVKYLSCPDKLQVAIDRDTFTFPHGREHELAFENFVKCLADTWKKVFFDNGQIVIRRSICK